MDKKPILKNNWIDKSMLISILFFVSVITLTIILFTYNKSLTNNIVNMNSKIENINNDIVELKKDDKIIIYNLVTSNSDFLSKYKKLSKITEYITYIDEVEKKFKLDLNWFNYNNWVINLAAKFDTNDQLASSLLNDFLQYYRDSENNDMFTLNFINSFVGQESIWFSTQFNLK